MAEKLTDVSFSLAKHVISAKAKHTNFVFSPLSIHVALGLIASGSGNPTQCTIFRFLKSSSIEELNSTLASLMSSVFANGKPLGGPHLSLANGVWFDKTLTLKPSFTEIADNVYKATSNHVDFSRNLDGQDIYEEANRWAKRKTYYLIKEILDPVFNYYSWERLIVANAVRFKANWQDTFDAAWNKDDNFFLLNGGSIRVPFMERAGTEEYVGVFDGFKVLRLLYEQGTTDTKRTFSMYVFLPDDVREGLPALVEKAGSVPGFIDRHLPRERVKVNRLVIPKFRLQFGFDAWEVLRRHGVALGCYLTRMVWPTKDWEYPNVSDIFHKSTIKVDEVGTEAAGVTTLTQGATLRKGVEGKVPVEFLAMEFVADHPFMFVIKEDESGAVLFIGQVLDPRAG